MSHSPPNLSNARVGTWHVLDLMPKPDHIPSKDWYPQFFCRCDCGNEQPQRATNIRRALQDKPALRLCRECGR
jgi:hypothetical protein